MKPERKHLFFTIGFYALYIIAAMITNEINPGGPCTPGLGAAMLILLIPIGVIGFVASAILMRLGSTRLKWSMWLHLSIPIVFYAIIWLVAQLH